MRIAVTGASGFLGASLIRALSARGDQAIALTRDPSRCSPRLVGVDCPRYPCTPEGLRLATNSGPVTVVHTATCYGRFGESSADLVDANVVLPLRLLGESQRIDRWISMGTALPAEVSPYAESKAQFGRWLERGDLQWPARVELLLQHLYGPGDDSGKFLTWVIRGCLKGERLELSEGIQRRDFIHVDDVVRAILTILDNPSIGGSPSVLGVGSGEARSLREVVLSIHAATGRRSELVFGARPLRSSEPMVMVEGSPDLRALGWCPRVSWTNGLAELIEQERKLLSCES